MISTVIYYILLCSMLVVVSIIDYKYQLIYDEILLSFAFAYLIFVLIRDKCLCSVSQAAFGAAAGLILYGALYFIARVMFRKEAFGSGDVFLLACIGLFLGFQKTLLSGILAFYVALIFIIIGGIKNAGIQRATMPFGPSVCISALISSVFGEEIIAYLMHLMHFA